MTTPLLPCILTVRPRLDETFPCQTVTAICSRRSITTLMIVARTGAFVVCELCVGGSTCHELTAHRGRHCRVYLSQHIRSIRSQRCDTRSHRSGMPRGQTTDSQPQSDYHGHGHVS